MYVLRKVPGGFLLTYLHSTSESTSIAGRCVPSMEEGEPPNEEEEEPTSEFVGDLELIFGRGKSGFKDIYP